MKDLKSVTYEPINSPCRLISNNGQQNMTYVMCLWNEMYHFQSSFLC